MAEDYQVVYVEKPEEAAWGVIGRGVHTYNVAQTGDTNFQRICFALQGPDEEIVGGVLGEVYWDWLYVDLLWVREGLRRRGYGRQLMAQLEESARQHGALQAYLDTFSFQAPGFYEALGYHVFGELAEFPAGHQRFFMTKAL